MTNKKQDPLDSLLENARDRDNNPDYSNNTNDLSFSEEEVEKLRLETMNKIDDHVKKMKKQMKKNDGLANYVLENRLTLLEQSRYMLNHYMTTILTTLHSSPRAFEILAKMFETIATINNSVLDHKEDKARTKDDNDRKLIQNTSELIGDIVKTNLDEAMKQNLFKNKEKSGIKVLKQKAE